MYSDGKDIFISYREDGASNNFAARLSDSLIRSGYAVFFNSNEHQSGSFPVRIEQAIMGCKDFIVVLSKSCLEQLKRNEKVDWVREELLLAQKCHKNIIPLLMPQVTMPKDKEEMPPDLQFLPMLDAIEMPEQYTVSPYEKLVSLFQSTVETKNKFKELDNSNTSFDVYSYFEQMKQEAADGSPEAMYELANMYFYGIASDNNDGSRDFAQAYYWLNRLAQTDSEYSEYALRYIGHMYYSGIVPGEPQSYEKCYELHSEIAKNNKNTLHHLAFMKSIGSGCEFVFEEAEELYKLSMQSEDSLAKFACADFYKSYGMFNKAEKIYETIYDKVPSAAYELGMIYKKGVHVTPPHPDYIRAAFYLQYAIQSETCGAEAYLELGKMYFNPTGPFPKNFRKAQEFFIKSSDLGNAEAQFRLAYMYDYGHIECSVRKAIYYYELSAEKGNLPSLVKLANLYQQEECRDYSKAVLFARKAAENGSAEGAFIYANLLLIGRGCRADVHDACKYYKFALEHGCEQAGFMLKRAETIRAGGIITEGV